MLKNLNLVICFAMVLLLWGAVDFYQYGVYGLGTIVQYIGTEAEDIVRALITNQLQDGIFKWLLGAGVMVACYMQKKMKDKA